MASPWSKGPILSASGELIFLDFEDFCNQILYGSGCCFCGRPMNEGAESDSEHVFSSWLLDWLRIHDVTYTRGANFVERKLGQEKIRICKEHNRLLKEKIEDRVAPVIKRMSFDLNLEISKPELWTISTWLTWTFLKLTIKKGREKLHLDRRKGQQPLLDHLDRREIWYAHCAVRAFVLDQVLHPSVAGSTLYRRVMKPLAPEGDLFSFYFNAIPPLVSIRIQDLCFIFCIGDAGMCRSVLESRGEVLHKIPDVLMISEAIAYLLYVRTTIATLPQQHLEYDDAADKYLLYRSIPPMKFLPENDEVREVIRSSVMRRYSTSAALHVND